MEKLKKLVLLRHAKAANTATSDFHRPLSPLGRELAKSQGDAMARTLGGMDLAIVSAATRASETCDALREGGLKIAEVRYESDLYEKNYADAALDLIHEVVSEVQTLLLVFHQPAVSELALRLSIPSDERVVRDGVFSPATFLWGTVEGDWAELKTWHLGGIVNP